MPTFSKEKIEIVKEYLAEAKEIVIIAHKSPDGDSVGSSLGLFHYLKKKGYNAKVCHPDPAPYFLEWLQGASDIINGVHSFEEANNLLLRADLIFCLDFNNSGRVGDLEGALKTSKAKKVLIDHHLYPSDEFDVLFSETSSCSTCQLIADFIDAMGDNDLLDEKIGNAIYCGIMTDSGSFRYPSVTAHTHEVVGRLIAHGVRPYIIHESVYDTNTLDKLQLNAFAINQRMTILEEFKTAIIQLSKEDLQKYNYRKGDTEGLVNVGLSIQGMEKSIFLMEHDGLIKISFRSKGEDNPVNEMASQYFNGGGHANAAGGKWNGTLEEAVQKVIEVLPQF